MTEDKKPTQAGIKEAEKKILNHNDAVHVALKFNNDLEVNSLLAEKRGMEMMLALLKPYLTA